MFYVSADQFHNVGKILHTTLFLKIKVVSVIDLLRLLLLSSKYFFFCFLLSLLSVCGASSKLFSFGTNSFSVAFACSVYRKTSTLNNLESKGYPSL